MPKRARFIAFAFASADFLVEVDARGGMAFAMGAVSEFAPQGFELQPGRSVAGLFAQGDALKFMSRVGTLKPGQRAAPVPLQLVRGGRASVSMFRMPHSDNVSCALSKSGPRSEIASAATDPETGLASRDALLTEALKTQGDLAVIELQDLPALCASLPQAKTDNLLGRIGDTLRGLASKAVGRLSLSSFGLVVESGAGMLDLTDVRALLAENGVSAARIREKLVSLKNTGLSEAQRLIALRHTVDRFTDGDHAEGGDLAAAFQSSMSRTQLKLAQLTNTVAEGSFTLAFQPIHALADGTLSHYEALSRFQPSETGETVKLVEQLGIANSFDLAVALKAIAALKESSWASIAFNVSGATIASPESFGLLAGFLARERKLASRLLVEITETAEIADLVAAGQAVKALRDMGLRVGLDDFGAGAASLNYLHAMPVDFVKFDGEMIRKLGASERDDTLLGGMVRLCHELGVKTVAECLETEDQVRRATAMGFDYGQGYHFGAADFKIYAPVKLTKRRQGAREEWR
jgi:EAL domain-containing protein (putative c-di-GMP-specific phosphodiesterase class I)